MDMQAILKQARNQPIDPKLKKMFKRIPAIPCGPDVAYRMLREAEAPVSEAAAPAAAPITRPPALQSGKGHSPIPVSTKVTQSSAAGGGTISGAKPPAAAPRVAKTPATAAAGAKTPADAVKVAQRPATAAVGAQTPAAAAKVGKSPAAAAKVAKSATKIEKRDTKA